MVYFSCWFRWIVGFAGCAVRLVSDVVVADCLVITGCSCCLRCFGFGVDWLVWVWVCGCFVLWCFTGCIALVLGFVDCQTVRLCLGWVI